MTKILSLNCGSSSIKFAVIEVNNKQALAVGLIEKIGTSTASLSWRLFDGSNYTEELKYIDYSQAIEKIAYILKEHKKSLMPIEAIGHRVVHGGEKFQTGCAIDDKTILAIEKCSILAPLHNPVNILGIRYAKQSFPNVFQAAIFDTAFHQSLPKHAYIYGLPYEWYEKNHVRRYGFHGTSHSYVTHKAAEILRINYNKAAFISLHLGNGCSACAVLNGKSVDTSMGMTPLEGLVMGTRSGDIDPGLFYFLNQSLNLSLEEIHDVLNHKSGLLGISALSQDMRELIEAAKIGNEKAKLAIEVFCFRIAKAVGGLMVSLQRLDALIFTGGIGENSALIRKKVLKQLQFLNFIINDTINEQNGEMTNGIITTSKSTTALIINTDEQLEIALQTYELYSQRQSCHIH